MSIAIALVGNPNCGKTTMFNQLTGAAQYVGNWPGVTVEKKEGKLRTDKSVTVVDLPGVYSLSPYSPEEVVSRDYLLGGSPDVILDMVDVTNLERNLYLTTQLLEVGLPVVMALNMADLMRKAGMQVDAKLLGELLGCEVMETSALRNTGLDEATGRAIQLAKKNVKGEAKLRFSEELEGYLGKITEIIEGKVMPEHLRWYTIKLFERDEAATAQLNLATGDITRLNGIIEEAEAALDDDSESIIIGERYDLISEIIGKTLKKKVTGLTTSDKIDRVVTNRWLALPIFVVIMFIVYFISIQTIGDVVTGWTNDTLFGELIGGNVAAAMEGVGAAEWAVSLVVDGIIGGVGAVIGFLPQMAILFILLSFLEDCGYLARVAFIMDRIFRRFGLSGKSFIPFLISSGCGVPGIMSTQTIEDEKDRRMTVITTTFIPCGAKLPIIALIAGAILSDAWWVAPVIYFVGIGSVILSGIILKKTKLFAGEPSPFVMEMPQYHLPAAKSMFLHVWERLRGFIVRAGTVIFISSVVIWFLLSFGVQDGAFGMVDVQYSFLAMIGGVIAPIFIPVGFGNWEASVGVVTGLVAKENLVATLAVVANLSDGAVEGILDDTMPLWVFVRTLLPTAAAGMSYLIFNMLCAPCFAAIGAIRRQMGSAKWTAFAVAYQCVFAYLISLMVFQFGTFFATGVFGVGTVVAIIALAFFLFMLFRPSSDPEKRMKNAATSAL